MASEVQETILKGILEGDKARFFLLSEKVRDEFFADEHRDLWAITQRVHDVSREIIDAATLEKVLARASLPVERITKVEELWRRLAARPAVSDVDFKSSIDILLQDHQRLLLGETFTTSLEILSRGVKDEKSGQIKFGPDDALSHFRTQLAAVEDVSMDVMPEFNIRERRLELLASLYEKNTMRRIPTGIVPFDEMTNGGIAAGELVMVVAGSGVGKSIVCTSIAQHVMQSGHNVIYFSTEVLFEQIETRIVIKHSRLPRFGIPGGLSSTAVKKHSAEDPHLTAEEVEAWTEVVNDFSSNPDYGQMVVVQIPKGTPMAQVEAKMNRWQQEMELDLCIIDSPDMLSSDVKYSDERQMLNDVINATKGLAVSFNGGKGTRILAPWQASRAGQERALASGRYDKSALAETAMAERRADVILALLEDTQTPTKIKGQTLKNRDGAPADFTLEADLDHYYIGSEEPLSGADVDISGLM